MIRVLPVWNRQSYIRAKCPVIPTISRSKPYRELSPFHLGPCKLYKNEWSRNMENAWQYSKLYEEYANKDGTPKNSYWDWAHKGWQNPSAVRYPMGKGRKPLGCLWWNGTDFDLLGYIDARKTIYGPLYAEAVQKTLTFAKLKRLYQEEGDIILLDYDAYDHRELDMSLTDVLNEPNRNMGHAFVLAMLLTNDKALRQMELR